MFIHILKWYEPVCVRVCVRVRVHLRVRVRVRESVRERESVCVLVRVHVRARVVCVCSVCVLCARVVCECGVYVHPLRPCFYFSVCLSHSRTPSLHRLLLISIHGHSYNGRIVPRYESKFFFWAHSGVFFWHRSRKYVAVCCSVLQCAA